MELKKIASFQVDHTKLERGMYLSRIDGDVVTWDLRMKKPNAEPVLPIAAIHTIEHLVATFLRSSERSGNILYFGPMGCRTGCYLLTRGLSNLEAIALVREAFEFMASFDGPIPGATAVECGNWKEHDLPTARKEAALYVPLLRGYGEERLQYAK